jgi:hypothetical protein
MICYGGFLKQKNVDIFLPNKYNMGYSESYRSKIHTDNLKNYGIIRNMHLDHLNDIEWPSEIEANMY